MSISTGLSFSAPCVAEQVKSDPVATASDCLSADRGLSDLVAATAASADGFTPVGGLFTEIDVLVGLVF